MGHISTNYKNTEQIRNRPSKMGQQSINISLEVCRDNIYYGMYNHPGAQAIKQIIRGDLAPTNGT